MFSLRISQPPRLQAIVLMSYYPRSTASSDIGTHASDRMWLYGVLTAQYAADAILKHCNFLLWEWHCAGYKHKINVPSWSAIQGLQWYSKDEQHCWERSVRGVIRVQGWCGQKAIFSAYAPFIVHTLGNSSPRNIQSLSTHLHASGKSDEVS